MNNTADILKRMNELTNRVENLKIKLVEATDLIHEQQDDLDFTSKNIRHLEKGLYNHQQYTRRENIEIIGIPDSIHATLEKTVLDVLHKINIDISSYDIAACHRLLEEKRM